MGGVSAWKQMQRKRTEWQNTGFDDSSAGGAGDGQRDNYYQPDNDDHGYDHGKWARDENGDEMTAAERDTYYVGHGADGHHTSDDGDGNSNEKMGGEESINDDNDHDVSVCSYLLLYSFSPSPSPRWLVRIISLGDHKNSPEANLQWRNKKPLAVLLDGYDAQISQHRIKSHWIRSIFTTMGRLNRSFWVRWSLAIHFTVAL